MNDLLRAFGRALVGALHPRVLGLTFLPFLIAGGGWGLALWFVWQPLIDAARGVLDGLSLTSWLYKLFATLGVPQLHTVVAPLLVVAALIPLIVMSVLVLIALLSMPVVIRHLSKTRFAALEARDGGGWFGSSVNALWAGIVSLVVLIVTLPLWLIPPFFVILPPLVWGWLTYRVMSYDALAHHASAEERKQLMRTHRWPLLLIGVVSGVLGTLPTLVWVSSLWTMVLFPFVAAVMIWGYAFILVFSALWFGFYCLRALEQQRAAAHGALDQTRQA
jgi:hypothetical protein